MHVDHGLQRRLSSQFLRCCGLLGLDQRCSFLDTGLRGKLNGLAGFSLDVTVSRVGTALFTSVR